MMRKILIAGLLALSLPAFAQSPVPAPAPPPPVVDQQGLSNHLRLSLMRCWTSPPGYEGRQVAVTINFKGDGTLTEEPEIELDGKSAKKNEILVESITAAFERCTPFEALEEFGVMAHQRFAIQIMFVG